jgi:hypothetical protein
MKENPLTMEMLLDQLAGLNIIQLAAIPLILLVITEWILTIIQKKDYYDSLDTISATFIGLINVGISAVLKIGILELYCFFIMFLEYPKRMVGLCSCIIALDFFRYWSHRLTHVIVLVGNSYTS